MKLRFPSPRQQLLFALFSGILFACAPAHAQQDATVVLKAKPTEAQPMKVIGVTGTSLMVKTPFGEQGLPLSQIQSVNMAPPPEVAAAQQAFEGKDYKKAFAAAKAVSDKFKGLPAPWAANMMALLGDIYLAQDDMAKAEAAYNDFAKSYPGNGAADLGKARIAVVKKDFDFAKKVAEPLAQKALSEKNAPPQAGQSYAQAFLVLGQVKEAQGDYQGALEDYLRTVTLFPYDRTAVGLAQERADALRKTQHVFVP